MARAGKKSEALGQPVVPPKELLVRVGSILRGRGLLVVHRLSICIGSNRLKLHSLVCLNVLRRGFHVDFRNRLRLSDDNGSSADIVRSRGGGSSAATAADDDDYDDDDDCFK